jgi:glycosyltransferase involved in cell wall biosynthesis
LGAVLAAQPDLDVVCAARAWPAVEPFEADGIRYVTLPGESPLGGIAGVRRAWMSDVREVAPVASMRCLVEDTRPDVVHVHGTETSNALALQQAANGIPVLISLQGLVTEIAPVFLEGLGPAGVLADIASLEFAKGRGLTHSYLRMRRAARTERRSLAAATDLTGRTDFDRQVAQRANASARYWHVGEVLRSPFYGTVWVGPTSGPPTVLAVASAAPYKGIDVLLKAYASVRGYRRCRLTVVGEFVGTPLWRSLDALQARLGLSGCVEWVGVQSAESVAALMAACSVFVSASRIENSPNSVCEAMLVGAPVVASRAGGTSSLIADGETGLLVATGDHQVLAGAIDRVLADRGLAQRLGQRARRVALVRHDPASVASSLLEVYGALAAGGSRR